MAWIESHQSLGTHKKLLILCEELHIDRTRAVGMLHYLWWWALDNAPDGNLKDIPATTIARAAHWNPKITLPVNHQKGRLNAEKIQEKSAIIQAKIEENAFKFIYALQLSGFMDDLSLHDWEDYAGKLIQSRNNNKEKQKKC